jgi:hypothetical protein
MKKLRFTFVSVAILAFSFTTFPVAQALPTQKSLSCAYGSNTNLLLAYGVNSVTITNPNNCQDFSGPANLTINYGANSTWTYSKTVAGVTTTGDYVAGSNLRTGGVGIADSFTLTLTSTNSDFILFTSDSLGQFSVYFNNQIDSVNPNPIVTGAQVTVSGSNLLGISTLTFQGPAFFTVSIERSTETQLSFTMPSTYVGMMSSGNVPAGNYKISLLIASNSVWVANFSVTSGSGTPVFSASTPSIPNTGVFSTSNIQTETITNTGTAPLVYGSGAVTKSGTHSSDFTILTDTCSTFSVLASASCTVTYTFTPSAAGIRATNLLFADNATGSPHAVILNAVGTTLPITITKLDELYASTRGGEDLTISGSGFANSATVTIGGTDAQILNRISNTKIKVRIPAHAAGVVSVVITNPDTGTASIGGFIFKRDSRKEESHRRD